MQQTARKMRALPPFLPHSITLFKSVTPVASPLLQESKMPVIPNLLRFSLFLV
jgi:hypothetical protein